MNGNKQQPRGAQGGFTLIEVMVALLILAIGVLGVGSMQVQTYQHLRTSQHYGNAAALAGDMADRMFANASEARNGSYVTSGIRSEASTSCDGSACTTAQLAGYDVAEWLSEVSGLDANGKALPGSLPSPRGTVSRVNGTDSYIITVHWDEDLSGSTDTNCPAQSDKDLDCYQLTVTL